MRTGVTFPREIMGTLEVFVGCKEVDLWRSNLRNDVRKGFVRQFVLCFNIAFSGLSISNKVVCRANVGSEDVQPIFFTEVPNFFCDSVKMGELDPPPCD